MNMKNKLRPIGTEFEVERPPMESSTSTETTITKYRIVAHKKVSTLQGNGTGMAEMLDVISIRFKEK